MNIFGDKKNKYQILNVKTQSVCYTLCQKEHVCLRPEIKAKIKNKRGLWQMYSKWIANGITIEMHKKWLFLERHCKWFYDRNV